MQLVNLYREDPATRNVYVVEFSHVIWDLCVEKELMMEQFLVLSMSMDAIEVCSLL